MKIYHNPRCRKSRETLQLIKEQGISPEVIEYLKTPPTADELNRVIELTGRPLKDFLRTKEAVFKTKFQGKNYSESEWLEVMVNYPQLIERPIVVNGEKAILGRPPENVKALF